MIDLDVVIYIEYEDSSKEPIAILETAVDVGQAYKSATVTAYMSKLTKSKIPAYVLLYELSDDDNPVDALVVKTLSRFRLAQSLA